MVEIQIDSKLSRLLTTGNSKQLTNTHLHQSINSIGLRKIPKRTPKKFLTDNTMQMVKLENEVFANSEKKPFKINREQEDSRITSIDKIQTMTAILG